MDTIDLHVCVFFCILFLALNVALIFPFSLFLDLNWLMLTSAWILVDVHVQWNLIVQAREERAVTIHQHHG